MDWDVRLYINGEDVTDLSYPAVRDGDSIKITGSVYEGSLSVSGAAINYTFKGVFCGNGSVTTDSDGYFEINEIVDACDAYCPGDDGLKSMLMTLSSDSLKKSFQCTFSCEEVSVNMVEITDWWVNGINKPSVIEVPEGEAVLIRVKATDCSRIEVNGEVKYSNGASVDTSISMGTVKYGQYSVYAYDVSDNHDYFVFTVVPPSFIDWSGLALPAAMVLGVLLLYVVFKD